MAVELCKCPKCGHLYSERPALSRVDNATLICPDCGTQEALDFLNIPESEQDSIKAAIKNAKNND